MNEHPKIFNQKLSFASFVFHCITIVTKEMHLETFSDPD